MRVRTPLRRTTRCATLLQSAAAVLDLTKTICKLNRRSSNRASAASLLRPSLGSAYRVTTWLSPLWQQMSRLCHHRIIICHTGALLVYILRSCRKELDDLASGEASPPAEGEGAVTGAALAGTAAGGGQKRDHSGGAGAGGAAAAGGHSHEGGSCSH